MARHLSLDELKSALPCGAQPVHHLLHSAKVTSLSPNPRRSSLEEHAPSAAVRSACLRRRQRDSRRSSCTRIRVEIGFDVPRRDHTPSPAPPAPQVRSSHSPHAPHPCVQRHDDLTTRTAIMSGCGACSPRMSHALSRSPHLPGEPVARMVPVVSRKSGSATASPADRARLIAAATG